MPITRPKSTKSTTKKSTNSKYTGVSTYPSAGKNKAESDSIRADYNTRNKYMTHTTKGDKILWNDNSLNTAGKKKGLTTIDKEAKKAGHTVAEKVRKTSANQYKCGGKLTSRSKKK